MLVAWSESQLDTVLLNSAHGEPGRCWCGARVAVLAGIDAMLAWEGRAVCQRWSCALTRTG
jgi:hypothetical protein